MSDIYDANAKQRFEFEVTENGQKFDTAHLYNSLPDSRYTQYRKDLNIAIKDDGLEVGNQFQANTNLWNELIESVENFDYDPNSDWKSLIDYSEKRESLMNYLAVVIVEPEVKATGKRTAVQHTTETVITEAYFNFPNISQQTHILKAVDEEWRKKYDRIVARQLREEATKGLRRKPQVLFIPQDEAFGALYDEMVIETVGFANGIPLRFKTKVLEFIFSGARLDEKK